MIVKIVASANGPSPRLERSHQSHEITSAAKNASDSGATQVPVPVNDQIALSLATKFLQPAANAGEQVRLERILQLKTAIVKEQYQYDPFVVGRALVEAHLGGE